MHPSHPQTWLFLVNFLFLPTTALPIIHPRSTQSSLSESDQITIALSVVFGSISILGVAAAVYQSLQVRRERQSATAQNIKAKEDEIVKLKAHYEKRINDLDVEQRDLEAGVQ